MYTHKHTYIYIYIYIHLLYIHVYIWYVALHHLRIYMQGEEVYIYIRTSVKYMYIYICVYKWYSFFGQWGHAGWVFWQIIFCCVGVDIYHILLCGCSRISPTAVWAFTHMNNCCAGVDTYVYCSSTPHSEHKWFTASFYLTKRTHTATAWKSGAARKISQKVALYQMCCIK